MRFFRDSCSADPGDRKAWVETGANGKHCYTTSLDGIDYDVSASNPRLGRQQQQRQRFAFLCTCKYVFHYRPFVTLCSPFLVVRLPFLK